MCVQSCTPLVDLEQTLEGMWGGCHRHKGLRVVTAFGTPTNVGTHIALLPGHYWHKLWDTGGATMMMTGILAIREIVPVTSLLEVVTVFWLDEEGNNPFLSSPPHSFSFQYSICSFMFSGWVSPPCPCLQQQLQYNWLSLTSDRFSRVRSNSCRGGEGGI